MIRFLEKKEAAGLTINCVKTNMRSLTGSASCYRRWYWYWHRKSYQQNQNNIWLAICNMSEQQFKYQLKVAAFQVQCGVRAAICMLYMESFKICYIETAGFHQPLLEEYSPYLFAKSNYKWGIDPKGRNLTSGDSNQKTEMGRQYNTYGNGVESVWLIRKSFWQTVSDLEKSSRSGDEKDWKKLVRAEITSQTLHMMASGYSRCPMFHSGLRTRSRRINLT